ncbi:MAG: hypothetical protein ACXAC6_15175 [Candidatus Hodarchaeales archaeon]|jgi:hypothetical protein
MVDKEEAELIRTDLDLVTKTAKVLSIKLEKISKRVEKMMSSLDLVAGQSKPTTSKPSPQPAPVSQTPQKAATPVESTPGRDSGTVAYDGSNAKVTRFFESFLAQIQSLSAGKDIAEAISRLRDEVMQSAGVGFHPAFHEMGKSATRLKNQRLVSEDDRQALIESILDWKVRLSGAK